MTVEVSTGSPEEHVLAGLGLAERDLAGRDAGPDDEPDAAALLELVVEGRQRALRLGGRLDAPAAGSSSCRNGSPKTATIASPMIFSIVPPCDSNTARMTSK